MKYSYPALSFTSVLLFCVISCTNPTENKTITKGTPEINKTIVSKPPSTYSDSLLVDFPAAVFYHPDTLQLKKLEAITDKRIFEGSMHEYFFQMRNARIVLKKDWPSIKIIEAKNVRYLLFKKKNKVVVCIDLDTKGDPYGLFLFDTQKDPDFTDMMNIDTQLYFYFKK